MSFIIGLITYPEDYINNNTKQFMVTRTYNRNVYKTICLLKFSLKVAHHS